MRQTMKNPSFICSPQSRLTSSRMNPCAVHTALTIVIVAIFSSACITPANALPSKSTFRLEESNPTPPVNSTLWYLQQTLTGIDRALTFFEREYKNVNLDGFIGTRILESTFNVILQSLHRDDLLDAVPEQYVTRIIRHRNRARDVSNAGVPYVIKYEAEYFARIGSVILPGLFELDYDSRDVDPTVERWPYNPNETMREYDSDTCLAEIFGQLSGIPCSISKQCWEMMTRLGYNRYSLTHEIFYLEIAEKSGCQLQMETQILLHNQGSLKKLHDTFCANILAESNLIAEKGFPEDSQDLFMEQVALCGMLGYRDFFSSDWLMKILSWQDPKDGCYRWDDWPPPKYNGGAFKEDKNKRRYKREELRVSRGCLSHRTAVAMAAMSQNVRYILEVWFQETVTHEIKRR